MNRWGTAFGRMAMFQFRDLYRNKIALFFNLIFPLILVVLFATLFATPAPTDGTSIGVVNEDRNGAGDGIVAALSQMDSFTVREGTVDELSGALHGGQVRAIVVIPADIGAAMTTTGGQETRNEPGFVDIVFDPISPVSSRTAAELRPIVDAIGMQMLGVQPAVVGRMESLAGAQQRDVFDYLMPGQMTIMLLAASLFTVGISVAIQRQTGAMRHLFSTPLPVTIWAATRITANLLMALVQGVILFGFAMTIYDVAPPANLPGTIVAVTISTLAGLGIGLLVGVIAKGEESALAMTMPIYMAFIFLGNAAIPLEDPPKVIAALLPYIPSYHMTEALRAVMRDGLPLGDVANHLAFLGVFAVVTLGVALWRMRRQFVVG